MARIPVDDWWRRLRARRAAAAPLLARARPRRWVVGYLEVCALVAALTVVTELVATSAGPPASLPDVLFVSSYYVAPLLYMLLFAVAVAASAFLLFTPLLQPAHHRRPLRAAAEAGCVWACYALLVAVSHWSADLRMSRLEAVTRPLTPAAIAHLTDPSRPMPRFAVRGCTELRRIDYDDGHAELHTECSRGIGDWDQLFLRADGRYEYPDRIRRLGAWAYFWD